MSDLFKRYETLEYIHDTKILYQIAQRDEHGITWIWKQVPLDLLDTLIRDIPEAHRNMRVVYDVVSDFVSSHMADLDDSYYDLVYATDRISLNFVVNGLREQDVDEIRGTGELLDDRSMEDHLHGFEPIQIEIRKHSTENAFVIHAQKHCLCKTLGKRVYLPKAFFVQQLVQM
jgi:hypothetical protein